MKLGFVCTNYNNSLLTRTAIQSLLTDGHASDIHVVVVDNRSHGEDVRALEAMARELPSVEVVLNRDNVGYFPGLNIGIHHLRTRFPDVVHLIVGNNDIEFPAGFVSTVERCRDIFDTWAVVAPDLVTPDGAHQNPHVLHQISRARRLIWDLYFLTYGAGVLIKHAASITQRLTVREENAMGGQLHKTPGPIEQGYGACYLLGPVFFRHFVQLCAPTFLMQEEFFLTEQLKTIGQTTYYDPRFVVTHAGHATMNRVPSRSYWEISREAHLVYKRYLAMSPEEQAGFVSGGSLRLT